MSDDDWMLDYAARRQRTRERVEDTAREHYLDAEHCLEELFGDVLAKQRKHNHSTIIAGHGNEPPAVRDLSRNSAGDGDVE